jgi:hypothetical protein
MTVQVSHKRIPTEIEPLRDHVRPLDPPEIREVVLQKAKRARECIDLTGDSDGEPPLKMRSSRKQPNGTITAQTTASTSPHTTPQLKIGSPGKENMGDDATYHSRFPQEVGLNITSMNASHVNKSDDFEHFSEEESGTSEAYQLPKITPFFYVGNEASFAPWSAEELGLSEVDLAHQLLRSDKLRTVGDRVGVTYSGASMPKTADQATQNAIALKAKIERDGVAKSKALRETAKFQNDRRVEQHNASKDPESSAKPPEYTPQEVGILNMFCRAKENNGGASELSGSTPDDSDGTSFSSFEYDDHLFVKPQAYPQIHEDREYRARNEEDVEVHLQLSPDILGHRPWIEIEDLEIGALQLENYTRLNDKNKAGPLTLFTSRHELDKFDSGRFASSNRQKFYSAYGEPVKKDVLVRAQNKNGGSPCSRKKPDWTTVLHKALSLSHIPAFPRVKSLSKHTSHRQSATLNSIMTLPSISGS